MRIVLLIVASICSTSLLAYNEQPLKTALEVLKNSKILRTYKITANYEFLAGEKFLSIWLYTQENEKIGFTMVQPKIPRDFIENILQNETPNRESRLINFLREIALKSSLLAWVSIENEFYKKRGLSYPLLCSAMNILKFVFEKDHVFLDDISAIPNFYEKLGFTKIASIKGVSKMYANLSNVIVSDLCQRALAR